MNLDLLLRAVEFVETNSDHDYCYSQFCSTEPLGKQVKEKTSRRRGYHNELERKRRADMRDNLEQLKKLVPSSSSQRRISTVRLLNEAATYINNLNAKSHQLEIDIKTLNFQLKSMQRRAQEIRKEIPCDGEPLFMQ